METVTEIFGWGLAYLLLAAPLSVAMGRFLSLSEGGAEGKVLLDEAKKGRLARPPRPVDATIDLHV